MQENIKNNGYVAEFNSDLNGYVLTFESGHIAQTQLEPETNRLHADFGKLFLRRYTEYDTELSAEEEALIDAFIEERNHSGEF